MRSRSKVFALLAVMALLAVGCLRIGGFRLTKQVVDSGEKTVLEMSLYRGQGEGEIEGKYFPLVIMWLPGAGGGSGVQTTDPRVFDVNERFGPARELVNDNELRDFIMSTGGDSTCEFFLRDDLSGPFRLVVLRTENRFNQDNGGMNAEALTRIGLKAVSEEPTSGGTLPFQAIVAGWDDDVNGAGAGTPAEEELLCFSDTWSGFTVRPDPDATPASSPAFGSTERLKAEIRER